MQTEFTLADLTKLTGVKRRTVQLWAEAGVIEAMPETERAGTGVHRRFSRQEAMIACVIAPLSLFQISIGALKGIAEYTRKAFNVDDGNRIERAIRENLPIYLLIAINAEKKFAVKIIDPAYAFEKQRENRGFFEEVGDQLDRLFPQKKREDDDYSWALGLELRKLEAQSAAALIALPITSRLQAFR